jgi:predicted amidohydrolase YtcJ
MKSVLVTNAKILTMDEQENTFSTLLIRNGIVERIADNLRSDDSNAEIIDAEGRLVTPGLIDTHLHFALTGLMLIYGVDLTASKDIAEVVERLKQRSRSWTSKFWLIGYNLNEFELKEGHLPDRYNLDEVSRELPIIVHQRSYHYAVANSKALQIGNVTRETKDPIGSRIGRSSNGEPNGVLYEFQAKNLVTGHQPPYELDDYIQAVQRASIECLKEGITCVKEPGGAGNDLSEDLRLRAMGRLSQNGELKIRIRSCVSIFTYSDLDKVISLSKRFPPDDFFLVIGFKIHHDGSGFARTAWMKEPWNLNYDHLDDDNRGMSQHGMENFRKIISEFSRENKMVTIHAIGDMAVETALEVIRDAKEKNPDNKSKYALVHVYIPSEEQMEKMKELDVCVDTQTPFIYFVGDTLIRNLGPTRAKQFLPMKTYLEKGVMVGNGSDSPVTPYGPRYGLYSCVTRKMRTPFRDIEYIAENQRIGLLDALRTYTSMAAKCVDEPRVGTLKQGSFADFVIWNKDFTKSEKNPEELLEIRPLSVYVSGKKIL